MYDKSEQLAQAVKKMPDTINHPGLLKAGSDIDRQATKMEEIRGNEDRTIQSLYSTNCKLSDILARCRGDVPVAATAKEDEGAPQGIVFEIMDKQQQTYELICSIEGKLTELEELL